MSERVQFERLGFRLLGQWRGEDSAGREGYSWVTLLLELGAGGEGRQLAECIVWCTARQ